MHKNPQQTDIWNIKSRSPIFRSPKLHCEFSTGLVLEGNSDQESHIVVTKYNTNVI